MDYAKYPTYQVLFHRLKLLEQRVQSLEAQRVAALDERPAAGTCPTLREILDAVALDYGISHLELLRRSNGRAVAWPRQCAMWLARHMTLLSCPEIGRILKMDHSTVIHGVRRHQERMQDDAVMRRTYAIRSAICERLESRRRPSQPQPQGAPSHA